MGQRMIAMNDPTSEFLANKYRLGYLPYEEQEAMEKYGITEEEMKRLLRVAFPGSPKTTLTGLGDIISGNTQWTSKSRSFRSKVVKKLLAGRRPELIYGDVTLWFNSRAGCTRRRPKVSVDPTTGESSRMRPILTPASELSKFQQELMKQEAQFGLAVTGKQTEMRTVHISRTVRSSQSPTGYEVVQVQKDYCGRFVPIVIAANEHLKDLLERGILKEDHGNIPILFWIDGSSQTSSQPRGHKH